MEDTRNAYNVSVGRLTARDHSEDIGIDGIITLQYILRSRMGGYGQDSSDSHQRPLADTHEHANEPLDSTKEGRISWLAVLHRVS